MALFHQEGGIECLGMTLTVCEPLQLEEQCESVSKDLVQTQSLLTDTEEEKKRLEGQSVQVG